MLGETGAEQGNGGSGQPAGGESANDAAPAAVPLKYHMDKAYNIVPNNEGTEKKVVLLTFDDGPKKAEWINGLIDTLDKHHAKAIFFVNGYRVKENPELLKLIHDRGQIVGNHSWDHISLRKEPEAKVRQQIEDVQNIVKATIGEAPSIFPSALRRRRRCRQKGRQGKRPPLHDLVQRVPGLDDEIQRKGQPPTGHPKRHGPASRLSSNILMHELPWTAEALDGLLTKLESKGYSFVDPRSIELEMR